MRRGLGVGLRDVGGGDRGRKEGNIRRTIEARRNWTIMWREVVKRGKWKSRWSSENIHLLYCCSQYVSD